ncbi:hypothetical protein ASPCADRAFT_7599 [Aspergillus carbonarius ITEM 5010]|uniref:Uncharacterized protein n=1 Tax=Aspergillus carbonarius (strain ITEM 5010) TaxID=602072 RepID=A0A1R3RFV8_ASPC5|nr:hypothetical protein ASPCADRAFT_7599 [Aspergillus carbonarius ITEM 5010]
MPPPTMPTSCIWTHLWIPVPVLNPSCNDITVGTILTDPFNPTNILLPHDQPSPTPHDKIETTDLGPTTMHLDLPAPKAQHTNLPTSLDYNIKSHTKTTCHQIMCMFERLVAPEVSEAMKSRPVYIITDVMVGRGVEICMRDLKVGGGGGEGSSSVRRFCSEEEVILAYRVSIARVEPDSVFLTMKAYEVDERVIVSKVAAMMEASCGEEAW